MLKPPDLTVPQYPVALKPTLGFEQQLLYSTQPALELGTFAVQGLNSGTYTPNIAENLALSALPAELLMILDDDINVTTDPVLTIVGTDIASTALNVNATIKPPAYSQLQAKVYPKGWAADLTLGKLAKTVTSVTIACDAALAGTKIRVFAVPSVETFTLLSTKTKLDWDSRAPKPHSIQNGRNMSQWVKRGEIPEGKCSFTGKVPSMCDGLSRINGVPVTGLIRELKEDKIVTCNVFLTGLVLTSAMSTGESVDPATLTADGLYQETGFIVAGP